MTLAPPLLQVHMVIFRLDWITRALLDKERPLYKRSCPQVLRNIFTVLLVGVDLQSTADSDESSLMAMPVQWIDEVSRGCVFRFVRAFAQLACTRRRTIANMLRPASPSVSLPSSGTSLSCWMSASGQNQATTLCHCLSPR